MRILLVEDHPAMRFGVRTLLNLSEDMEVVGEAENAGEALRIARDTHLDLAIVDLQLKGQASGVELCRELKGSPDPPRVLVYTAHNSREQASAALLSGADGFLHKGLDHQQLLEAIRRTFYGERIWLLGAEEEEAADWLEAAQEKANLTGREQEILSLLRKHRTNPEIARELCVSLDTVKTHTRKVLRKLGLKSRRELFWPE